MRDVCAAIRQRVFGDPAQAREEFSRSGCTAPPRLRYRPLAISPGELKRALYSINIGRIEDPTLEDLFREKQLEMDHQLTVRLPVDPDARAGARRSTSRRRDRTRW